MFCYEARKTAIAENEHENRSADGQYVRAFVIAGVSNHDRLALPRRRPVALRPIDAHDERDDAIDPLA